MQNIILLLGFIIISSASSQLNAQYAKQDITYKKCFVGSTFAMLGNLLPDEKPDFVQLNIGYRITGRDAVSLELKTWRYFEPLGIPYGKPKNDPLENFPGYIKEKGFAIAYQHFWWKSLYTGVHVMFAWQNFIDDDNKKIDNGFQVFNTYRAGYHIKLFKGKFFIEPSIAITHRPYHSKMPESFEQMDNKWPKFFLGEPGLHFGYNFY
ncbi:MAG: hypothetical protein ACSHWW_13715 [Nonlabens sp.]|uniref:hypothetical protein n=1 Tax=Nonlabens sp. TaxID=1888209 RepID=UPI003EF87D01